MSAMAGGKKIQFTPDLAGCKFMLILTQAIFGHAQYNTANYSVHISYVQLNALSKITDFVCQLESNTDRNILPHLLTCFMLSFGVFPCLEQAESSPNVRYVPVTRSTTRQGRNDTKLGSSDFSS